MRKSVLSTCGTHLAAVVFATISFTGVLAPAYAGSLFDKFAKPFETYYGSGANGQPGVPDFKFTRDNFAKSDLKAIAHLTLDAGISHFKGYTIYYNPGKDEVLVWGSVGSYSEAVEAKTIGYGVIDCGAMTYGTIEYIGGVPTCVAGSSIGTASTSPQPVLLGTIPGQTRSCTWDPGKQGGDTHSC